MAVQVVYDPAKAMRNRVKHGLSFDDFTGFDSPPYVEVDDRRDYGEVRLRAFGRIAGVGHSVTFMRVSGGIRLISFRRAHEKEMRRYE